MTTMLYDDIKEKIDTLLEDNEEGRISAADMREVLKDTIDSLYTTGFASYVDGAHATSGTAVEVPGNTDYVLPNNNSTSITSQLPLDVNAFYTPASLKYDALTEDFIVGELVTGQTSGATATIIECFNDTEGTLYLSAITGVFQDNETITGETSGSASVVGTDVAGRIVGRQGDGFNAMILFQAIPSNNDQWLDVSIDIGGSFGKIFTDTLSFPKGSGVARSVKYSVPSGYQLDTFQKNGGKITVRSNHDIDIYAITFNFSRTHKAR